jgi:hypothetical protein
MSSGNQIGLRAEPITNRACSLCHLPEENEVSSQFKKEFGGASKNRVNTVQIATCLSDVNHMISLRKLIAKDLHMHPVFLAQTPAPLSHFSYPPGD